MTMNVNLTPELVKFVHDKVKAGRYNSASEVVRELLRQEWEAEERRDAMDRLIDEGLASPAIDGEKAFAQLRAYAAKRTKEINAATAAKARKAA